MDEMIKRVSGQPQESDGPPIDPVGAWYAGRGGMHYEWPMTDLKCALEVAVEELRIAMDVLDGVSESRDDQDEVILDEMMRVGRVLDAARGLLTLHPQIESEYAAELAERDRDN